jgi:hypothetical protein
MSTDTAPSYLQPYLRAAQRHGGGFGSLLWASPKTQRARFDAICRAFDPTGRRLLDAGCGRADLLQFLHDRGAVPSHYTGIEAVDELADAADALSLPNATIVRKDFVQHGDCLFAGADVIVFSGSLNTLDPFSFRLAIQTAYRAAAKAVVFNFLSSPFLSAAPHLTWHKPSEVLNSCRQLPGAAAMRIEDYLRGDCTIAIVKEIP